MLSIHVGRSKAPRNTDRCPGDQNKWLATSSQEFVPLCMCEDEYAHIFWFPFEELYQLKLGVLVLYNTQRRAPPVFRSLTSMLKLAWAWNVLAARPRCRVLLVKWLLLSGAWDLFSSLARTFVEFLLVNCPSVSSQGQLDANFCFPEDFIFTFFSACSSRSFHHPTCVIHLAYTHYHCMSWDKYGLISRTPYLP